MLRAQYVQHPQRGCFLDVSYQKTAKKQTCFLVGFVMFYAIYANQSLLPFRLKNYLPALFAEETRRRSPNRRCTNAAARHLRRGFPWPNKDIPSFALSKAFLGNVWKCYVHRLHFAEIYRKTHTPGKITTFLGKSRNLGFNMVYLGKTCFSLIVCFTGMFFF